MNVILVVMTVVSMLSVSTLLEAIIVHVSVAMRVMV